VTYPIWKTRRLPDCRSAKAKGYTTVKVIEHVLIWKLSVKMLIGYGKYISRGCVCRLLTFKKQCSVYQRCWQFRTDSWIYHTYL